MAYLKQLAKKQPWLVPLVCLICALANGYEAIYVRPNSVMSIVDWAFAIAGAIAFVGLTLSVISDYLCKTDE